jgi:hypothetical protein
VFHNSTLRGGAVFSTQRGQDAKTREGKTVRVSDFGFLLAFGFWHWTFPPPFVSQLSTRDFKIPRSFGTCGICKIKSSKLQKFGRNPGDLVGLERVEKSFGNLVCFIVRCCALG